MFQNHCSRFVAVLMLQASGGLMAAEFDAYTEPIRTVEVAAYVGGTVDEVFVTRGDRVRKGDLLVRLNDELLVASRAIARARAAGQARLQALEVEFRLKGKRHQKLQELWDQNVGSADEVARAQADTDLARLAIEGAREEITLRELELQEIEMRMLQTQVRAPMDGIVTEVAKEVGEHLSGTQPQVVTLVQLDRLRATFYVEPFFARLLKAGQEVRLSFPGQAARKAVADETTQTIGRVEYVGVTTDAASGRVRVDVVVDNQGERWASGALCRLNLDAPGAPAVWRDQARFQKSTEALEASRMRQLRLREKIDEARALQETQAQVVVLQDELARVEKLYAAKLVPKAKVLELKARIRALELSNLQTPEIQRLRTELERLDGSLGRDH